MRYAIAILVLAFVAWQAYGLGYSQAVKHLPEYVEQREKERLDWQLHFAGMKQITSAEEEVCFALIEDVKDLIADQYAEEDRSRSNQ